MLNKSLFLSFFLVLSLTSYAGFEPKLTIEKYVRTIEINADGTNTETEEELDNELYRYYVETCHQDKVIEDLLTKLNDKI